MLFTGTQKLSIPKVYQLYFELTDIVVDSWDSYSFSVDQYGPDEFRNLTGTPTLFSFTSGRVNNSTNIFIGSYNTGEPFSISGYLNAGNTSHYYVNDVLVTDNSLSGFARLGFLNIASPSTASLSCNVKLKTEPIKYTLTLPNFNVGESITGELTTDVSVMNFGSSFQPYNSYETLLSGGSIISQSSVV
jgi:hypothetical protein